MLYKSKGHSEHRAGLQNGSQPQCPDLSSNLQDAVVVWLQFCSFGVCVCAGGSASLLVPHKLMS